MQGPRSDDAWWLASRDEIESDAAGSARGLTSSEAESRLRSAGPNRFFDVHRRPVWLQFLARFRNPLVLLLLVASALSALTGDVTGFLIVFAMVLLSVSIDFAQEYRAGRVADRLRQQVALRARVHRDGAVREIPVAEVVPGDIVLVTAGDLVPADALVIEAKDCFVQQSLLTGESYPVEKHAGVVPADAGLESAVNALFMGSAVISGSATGLVVRTGNRTAMGSIAGSLARTPPPNAF